MKKASSSAINIVNTSEKLKLSLRTSIGRCVVVICDNFIEFVVDTDGSPSLRILVDGGCDGIDSHRVTSCRRRPSHL